jgi:hypothetical protein
VLELGVPDAVRKRVETLAELTDEGLLTEDERAEYEALINADIGPHEGQ